MTYVFSTWSPREQRVLKPRLSLKMTVKSSLKLPGKGLRATEKSPSSKPPLHLSWMLAGLGKSAQQLALWGLVWGLIADAKWLY